MKIKFIGRLVAVGALVTSFTGQVQAATLTWTNNTDGLWHVAGNWSPNQVPGAADVAIFNRNLTLIVTNDVSVTELQLLSAGTLNVTNGSMVAANLIWNGGSLRGTVQCGGGSIGAGTTKYLVGGALANAGTLTWADSIYIGTDNYGVNNNGVLSNLVSGAINITGDISANGYYNGGTIYNAGVINKTGGAGTMIFNHGAVHSSGSISVNSGTICFNWGGSSSGNITVSTGNTLQFNNSGTFTFGGASTVTGAGNLWVSGGTVNVNGGYDLAGTNSFTGGNAYFNGNYAVTGPIVTTAGAAYFNNAGVGTVNVPSVTMTGGGGLGGTNLVQTTTLTWNGGWLSVPMRSGGGSIGAGTTKYLVGGTLVNAGTLTWGDGIYIGTDNYGVNNNGVLSNLVSGVINLTGDVSANSYYNGGYIYNAGQLNKTGGSGTATFGHGPFYNSGSVSVALGTLNIAGGGSSSGSMTVSAGSTLQFGAGVYTLAGGSTVTGAGNLWVSGGTVNVNGGYDLAGTNSFTGGNAYFNGNYAVTGPIVTTAGAAYFNNAGVGTVNVPSVTMTGGGGLGGTNLVQTTTLTWNAGWLRVLLNCGGGSIGSGSTKYLVGGTLVNAGTLTWGDGIYIGTDTYGVNNNGVLSNLVSGVINLTGDVSANSYYDGGYIYNAGQLNKTGGSGTATFGHGPFYNSGSVSVQAGTLNIAGGGSSSGSLTVSGGSTLQFGAGVYTLAGGSTVTGAGNLLVSGGAPTFNGGYNLTGTNSFISGSASFNGNYNVSGPVVITGGAVYYNNVGGGVVNVPTVALTGGGTLGGTNSVTVANFTWNAGWLRVLLNCGGGSIGSGSTKYLVGGTLVNAGTLTWADTIYMGTDGYAATNNGVISNLVSGTVNVTVDLQLNSYYTGGFIYNAGAFNKTGGSGTTHFYSGTLYNSGSVAISSGMLNLAAGGSSSGSMTVSDADTLQFGGGTFVLDGDSSVTGAGNLWVSSGTVTFNGGYDLTGTNTFTGGTASFNGDYTITGPVTITGGAAYFNNVGVGIFNVPTLAMTGGGTLGGTNALTAANFIWNGGWLRASLNGGGGSIGGGTTKYLVGGTLINGGPLAWADTIYMGTDGYAATNYGVISNLVSGVINVTADLQINSHYTGGFLYNAGQLNKTGGSGTTHFYNGTLYNSGSMMIDSGMLNVAAGGSSSGSMAISPAATLYFSSNFNFNDGSSVGGGGGFTVASGTVNFTGTALFTNSVASLTGGSVNFNNTASGVVNIPTLVMTGGGTLDGANPINAGALTWNGGWLRAMVTCGGGSIGSGTTKYLVNGRLNNAGTLTWADSIYMGTDGYAATNYGVISNLISGVINVPVDLQVNSHYTGGFIYNAGQLIKAGGTNTTHFYNSTLHNNGTLTINSGTLNVAAGGSSSGRAVINPAATLYFSSNFDFNDGSIVGGGGGFTAASGTINFNGTALFTNTVASLTGGSVNFNNTPGGAVEIPTLTMTGGGTLGGTNPVTAGTLTWNGGWLRNTLTSGNGSIGGGTTKYVVGGTWINVGAVTWSDTLYLGTDGYAATNYGVISNLVSGIMNITTDLSVGSYYNNGLIYNLGAVNKTSGSGTVNISSAFHNFGTLNAQTGTFSFNTSGGLISHDGTLAFGLTGTNAYGRMTVSGTVGLNGTLWAEPLAGYVPVPGDRFTLLTASPRTNTFTKLNLGQAPGVAWQVGYSPTAVSLTALAAGAGSVNIAGTVTDFNAQPVGNLVVYAFSTSGTNQYYVSTVTAPNGQYSLGVTNGSWRVSVQGAVARGYDDPTPQDVVLSGSDGTANFVLAPYSGAFYSIVAANNPSGAGYVSGAGNYYAGTTNTLTAVASNGYYFANWTENAVIVGTSNVLTFVANTNRSFVANFGEAHTYHIVTVATSPTNLTSIAGAGTYTNGETAMLSAPSVVLSGTSNYFFQRFTLTNATASTSNAFNKTFSTLDPTNLHYVVVYTGLRTNPVIAMVSPSRNGVIPTNDNFTLTFRFDRPMDTNVTPVVLLTNIVSGGVQPVVAGAGNWSAYWQANDSYTTPAIMFTNGMDGTNLVYVSGASDTNGGMLLLTNAYSFAVDTVYPTLADVSAVPAITSALISWNSSEPASTIVDYGLTAAYGATTSGSASATNHTVMLNSLTALTTYHYRVRSVDVAGNTSVSADATFTTLAAPDLLVTNLSITGNLQSGGTIMISWADTNAGSVATYNYWYDQVIVSNLTTSVQLLNTYLYYNPAVSGALAAGTAQNRSVNVTLPNGDAGVGNLQVTVIVDAYNHQYEFNLAGTAENNNRASTTATASLAAYPDLQVTGLIVTNAPLRSGGTVNLVWQDQNSGSDAVTNLFYDRLTVVNVTNGQVLVNTLVTYDPVVAGAIVGGGAAARQFNFTLPDGPTGAGDFLVTVATDNGNQVYEYNPGGTAEVNNTNLLAITSILSPYPDLVITNVIAPLAASAGQVVSVVWTDVNQGAAAVTNAWFDQVFLSSSNALGGGQLLATRSITNQLAAGQSLVLTQAVTLPAFVTGDQWLIVKANVAASFYESSLTNNSTIAAAPINLASTLQLVLSPANVLESAGSNAVLATVARNGDLSVPLTVSLSSTLTNLVLPSSLTLPAGHSATNLYFGVVNNFIAGDTASGFVFATASGFPAVNAPLTITDDDTAQLTLLLGASQIPENAGTNAVAGLITRNANLGTVINVTFTSDRPDTILAPATVTIPAGSASAVFALTPVPDGQLAGGRRARITAMASGYGPVSAGIDVLNADVVALSLALENSVVSEGAGPIATVGTVTRNVVTTNAQSVQLTKSGSALVTVPNTVTIPANAASTTFNVSVGTDGLVTGAQTAFLIANPLNSSSGPETLGEAQISLQVLDTNGPSLSLQMADALISKGSNTIATLTRNTAATNALLVTLSSNPTGVVAVLPAVELAVNQTSTNFVVTGILDGQQTGNRETVIRATAPGFNAAARALTVSDIYLPDLVPAIVSTPTNAYTEQQISITWRVTNNGLGGTTNQSWFDYIYLATDGGGGGQTLFAAKPNVKALAVGESYTNTASFYLPSLPGSFWIVAEANGNRTLTELKTANNTVFSGVPLKANAAYRAELVTAAPTMAGAGTPIVFQGRTFNPTNNAPMPNRPATVRVLVNDTRRIFPVTSDASGNFTYTFQPLANEAGDYIACADHPSVTNLSAQVSFALLGMAALPPSLAPVLLPNTPVTGTLLLTNLTAYELSDLAFTTPNLGTNLSAQFTFTNTVLPAYDVVAVNYTLTSPLTRAAQMNFLATITSAEGATLSLPLYVKVVPTLAQLVATPAYLQRGMVRGEQSVVAVTIENTGGTASGDLTVQIPSLPWLSLGSATNIPSIPAGSNTVVTLLLNPAADLTLGLYNGNIAVANQNIGVSIPYQFRAVSSGIGELVVNVTDDYTYYVAGEPKVTNAIVVLRDPFTGSIVAQTNSGTTGIAQFSSVPEGGYTVDVTAEKHNQFRGTASVVPGITNTLEAFLPRQLVTYQWSVVPTEIEDKYKIVLESVFETEVPVPNVVVEEPQVMVIVAPGEVTQFDIKLTNQGLIAANDVEVEVPYNSTYLVTPLVAKIGKIPAKSSVTVPVTVQLRAAPGGALAMNSPGGPQAADGGGCTLEDINGCLPKIPLRAKYSYPCGNNNVGQNRSIDLSIICAGKSAKECFDELRGLLGSGNLISVGCNAINAFLACVGADLTACQKAAISTACGAALGGLAGAAGAGGGGLLECICSHLDDIPWPSFGGGSSTSTGGGVLLPILPTGGYYACGNPVVTYIYIPGGNCSGNAPTAGAPGQTITYPGYSPVGAPRLRSPIKANADAGVCARVRLRINQEVTLTRAAFAGTLEIENGGDASITGVQVTLDFRDGAGQSASAKFVTEGPVLTGLTAVDGSGELAGGATGRSVYTFIPTTLAAPDRPYTYQIGGTLRYIDDGQEVVVPLVSAPITVYPEAKLDLVYFQQRDVYGDDPFTLPVEPSEPYTLGLIVKNIGAGDAKNFEITSAQPQIIENEKGLLIDFSIIGTSVGSNAISPSLTANVGNIPAGNSRTVNWQLISSLQGKFISFSASFEHVDGLGRTNLSLINSIETHELIHPVRANRVTDDGIQDYLVNDLADAQNLPDLLYLNTGAVEPVNVVTNGGFNGAVGPGQWQVQLTTTVGTGWNYFRLPDPGPGYLLASVVRSDGKVLPLTNNAWTTDRSFPSSSPGAIKENLLHLFDWAGSGQYTLTYRSTNTATPYIVQFVPLTPFTQTGAVATATIIFSTQMDLNTFNFSDLSLTQDGGTNLISAASGVSIVLASNATYLITGLAPLTADDGNYSLQVSGSTVSDVWGNSLGNVSAAIAWARGNAAPVVESISTITPNPRNVPVAALAVTFSKPVNPATFALSAVQLTRDGGPNLIDAGVTLSTSDNLTFTVTGLGALSGAEGNYTFTVNAGNVMDTLGTTGQGTKTRAWSMITAAPHIITLSPVTTNPRNIVVQNLSVAFSHPIDPTTFNHQDLALTRNGGPNLINSGVTVTALTPTNYQIGEISWVQGLAGDYVFTVNAAGLQDLAGNVGTGSANVSWQMILDTPPTPTNLVVTPDLGISSFDGLTSTNPVTLFGTVAGTNLTVRVFDTSTAADLGLALMNGTNFSASLLFATDGTHRLRITAIDAAGNVSSAAFVTVVIDQIRPSASIVPVLNPIYSAINTVTITFTEGINPDSIATNQFTVIRNGTDVLIPTAKVIASNLVQLIDLGTFTDPLGEYTVVADLQGITDYAGNVATNRLTMSWLRESLNQPPHFVDLLSNLVVTPDGSVHRKILVEDPDADDVTFSLAAAPAGATLGATNGIFYWRPTRANASTSHAVTVQVTDHGNPPMSTNATFNIVVLDYLDVSLGETNLLGGDSATLPIFVASSEGVTNLSFQLPVPFQALTNWVLSAVGPHLATADLQTDATQLLVQMQTPPGLAIQGTQQVAQLQFLAPTNAMSQFLRLTVTNLGGIKPGALSYSNNVNGGGRVVVVQAQPLLEALVLSNQFRQLAVYGRPGTNYQLQVTHSLVPPIVWETQPGFNQTNVLVPLLVPNTNSPIFYRLEEMP